jgi:hypothetical protein
LFDQTFYQCSAGKAASESMSYPKLLGHLLASTIQLIALISIRNDTRAVCDSIPEISVVSSKPIVCRAELTDPLPGARIAPARRIWGVLADAL